MTSHEFFKELGYIDPKMIEAAAPGEKRTRRTAWIKWVSVAACFVLLVSASLWLIAPNEGAYEQVEITTLIRLDERYYASYIRVNEMSNYERLTLEGKIGDLYLETETQSLYKIKGHDDIAELIAVPSDGEAQLFRFKALNYYNNDQAEPFSLGFLLETVYNVTSADDVRSVKFEKEYSYKNDREIKVQSVLVGDRANITHFFDQACALEGEEYQPSKYQYVHKQSDAYLNGTLPLTAQVVRKVTVKFKNNTSIEFTLDPLNQHLCLRNAIVFPISEQDLNWLIALAEINMQHVDYGTENDEIKSGVGEVTETPRPAPSFDLLAREAVSSVSISSVPEGYHYSFDGEAAEEVVDYFVNLNLITDFDENPKEYSGMSWEITIAYDNGTSETVYHYANMFVRLEGGFWYKMNQDEALRFDALLYELESKQH